MLSFSGHGRLFLTKVSRFSSRQRARSLRPLPPKPWAALAHLNAVDGRDHSGSNDASASYEKLAFSGHSGFDDGGCVLGRRRTNRLSTFSLYFVIIIWIPLQWISLFFINRIVLCFKKITFHFTETPLFIKYPCKCLLPWREITFSIKKRRCTPRSVHLTDRQNMHEVPLTCATETRILQREEADV